MFKPYSMFIGLRYAGAKRAIDSKNNNQLVSFISRVSILGMVLGVALLIVVLSVMNGFDKEMRERILGLVPQVTISHYSVPDGSDDSLNWQAIESIVLSHSDVVAVAPFTQLNAMLMRGDSVQAIVLFGIDPAKETNVSIIGEFISQESLAKLSNPNTIILGQALAEKLEVSVGGRLNVMVPQENSQGRIVPIYSRLMIIGIIETGTELDQSTALVSLGDALKLMPADQQQQGLRLALKDIFQAPRVAWELSNNIPYGYRTSDWTRSHGNLYSAIQLSKQLVGLMLVIIIAVAAFNVVSALVMIVTDKRGDIAILRTAGASTRGVMAIFVIQGTSIGLMGTIIGVVIGVILSLGITDIVFFFEQLFNLQLLNTDVYPVDYVPSDLILADIALVAVTAFIMSVLSTIYPAWRAANVQPAEALRYE